MKNRKILFITGSRGEYGYIRPVIREIQKMPGLSYDILATNMHLLDEFGYSLSEIQKDGFHISSTIFNTLDGYNRLTMVKSLGIFLQQLPETIHQINPNIIVLAGDRGEQLMAAIVGAHLYIPVAHIQAGEISANIDGTVRHAITKFAHIHFAATRKSAQRVLAMGEQAFRVFQTGAPMLDELYAQKVTSRKELEKKYQVSFDKPVLLLVYHPTTEDYDSIEREAKEVVAAVNYFQIPTIVILPNSDAGSSMIKNVLFKERKDFIRIYRNLAREDYTGLMKNSAVMVGNSSSGIIEAPCFKLPAVNVGRRQEGRECTGNVIHSPADSQSIILAVKKALSKEFRRKAVKAINPYGDGTASRKIVKVLQTIKIGEKLLFKKLRY